MSPQSLNGARILVAEDEPPVALEIGAGLVGAGAVLDWPFRYGRQRAGPGRRRNGVPHGCGTLRAFKIPFVFHTGDAVGRTLAADLPDNEVLSKPADRDGIVIANEIQPSQTVADPAGTDERLKREIPRITLPMLILHGALVHEPCRRQHFAG